MTGTARTGAPPVRAALALGLALVASACAGVGDGWQAGRPADPATRSCERALDEIRRSVIDAGVSDAEAAPVAGFAYLRIDRPLAHLAPKAADGGAPAFEAWVDRMQAEFETGTAVELANLPAAKRAALARAIGAIDPGLAPLDAVAAECAPRLRRRDLADPAARAALVRRARVPDSYSDVARVVGLYPLTAIPVRLGWEMWKRRHLVPFGRPAGSSPVSGRLVDYRPPPGAAAPAGEVAAIVEASRDPALGIPEPTGADRARLIAAFAPVLRVDVTGDHDRIGHPYWPRAGGPAEIDPARPAVFARLGYAAFESDLLLQITYAAWFPERPRDGPLDLLGGHLDAVLWRVTVDRDGRPLMYDTIHACGCYHLFFPVPPLARRPDAGGGFAETAVVPKPAPVPAPGARPVLRLAARSHYLTNVFADGPEAGVEIVRYRLEADAALRSLPVPGGGRRSLFEADGLVAGTERLERFLLWPMGIASPGAMRQWGNHATAFVGRRHFDDPLLIEESFAR